MYSYCCIYSFKIFPFSVCMAYLQSFKIKFRIISRIVVSHLGIINFIYIKVFTEKFLWDYLLNIHKGAFWEGIQVILNFALLLKFLNACIISAEIEWWNCVTSRDLAQQEGWFRKGTDLTRPAQHQDGTACSPSRREQWRLFHFMLLPALSQCICVHKSKQAGHCPVTLGRYLNVTRAFSPQPTGNSFWTSPVSLPPRGLISVITAVPATLRGLSTILTTVSTVLGLSLWLISRLLM